MTTISISPFAPFSAVQTDSSCGNCESKFFTRTYLFWRRGLSRSGTSPTVLTKFVIGCISVWLKIQNCQYCVNIHLTLF